jgi:hypothetical protein
MRTTVAISDPLLENTKQYAEQRGTTVSNVSRSADAPATPFKLHTVKGRMVDPNRNLDRISELVAVADEEEYRANR